MPLYNVASNHALRPVVRRAVAEAITDAHASSTGAPPALVSVIFAERMPLAPQMQLAVIGGVRIGGNRDRAAIERLRDAVTTAVVAAARLHREQVKVELVGFDPQWVMEAGELLPEPGKERDR